MTKQILQIRMETIKTYFEIFKKKNKNETSVVNWALYIMNNTIENIRSSEEFTKEEHDAIIKHLKIITKAILYHTEADTDNNVFSNIEKMIHV